MGAVKGNTLTVPVLATAAMPRKRFTSPTGGFPTAGGNTAGVTDMPAAIGDTMLIDHVGLTVVESGAALATAGAFLATDAQGRAIAWATGNVRVAILANITGNTATAAGQLVSVFHLPNAMPTT